MSGLLASRGDVEDIGCHGEILGYPYLYVLLFCYVRSIQFVVMIYVVKGVLLWPPISKRIEKH